MEKTGEILLPNSPSWFNNDTFSGRQDDNVLVVASFKTIVVFKVDKNTGVPKVMKIIPFDLSKVIGVAIYPKCNTEYYGDTVASISDKGEVRLHNFHSGELLNKYSAQRDLASLAWGSVGGESVLAIVGSGNQIGLWLPQHSIVRSVTVHQCKKISLIKVSPHNTENAVVVADKSIIYVSLKGGEVLTELKGHDYEVFSIMWLPAKPFTSDIVFNTRAELLRGESRERKNNGAEENGPFIVSSDYGRNVFIWNLESRRYLSKTNVPVEAGSGKRGSQKSKDRGSKQHIALAWYKNNLITSTITGEVLKWTVQHSGHLGDWKVLHHCHTRVIFNLYMLGDIIISSGQDRLLVGYNIASNDILFTLPTLGSSACSLSFCHQDANRLAVGLNEDRILVINIGSTVPYKTRSIVNRLKGRVLTLDWHPYHEGRLLYGTSWGQVGWIEAVSNHVTTFARYHQRPVYKVEWAPPVWQAKTKVEDAWCAYSLADGELCLHKPSDTQADPVKLKSFFEEGEYPKKGLTEFSFSPDYSYLALGCSDGQIYILNSADFKLLVKIVVVKKSIQHLLWKPPGPQEQSDVLAVASNMNVISLFNLDKTLQDAADGMVTIKQATCDLAGHSSKVVWLAWSPHEENILASASYDRTVQLWNVTTGEMLCNYWGHTSRVLRVEFSPSDPDLMYSLGDENNVHFWRRSQQTARSPGEGKALMKEYKPEEEVDEDASKKDEAQLDQAANISEEKKKANSLKKASFKSFFPHFTSVSSRKKSFHQISLLHLASTMKAEETREVQVEELTDDLDDLEMEDSEDKKQSSTSTIPKPSIQSTTESFRCLFETEETPSSEDISDCLRFYGPVQEMDQFLAKEVEVLESKNNLLESNKVQLWRGALATHIRTAAMKKQLDPFLVASAPKVSLKLWEFACQEYADQLIEEGSFIQAASYLININKVEEAVDLLAKNKQYRIALAILKCQLGYNKELLTRVTQSAAHVCTIEGNFEGAALFYQSLGQTEDAAWVLSKRSDAGSLLTAAHLHTLAGESDMATATGFLALKAASLKHDWNKMDLIFKLFPDLKWYQLIHACHLQMVKILDRVQAEKWHISHNYWVQSEHEGASSGSISFMLAVKQEWEKKGLTSDSENCSLYKVVKENFVTLQRPTSVKQMWMLVAVELSLMLLCPSEFIENHLKAALEYVLEMKKLDHIYHFSHILLPDGPKNLDTLVILSSDKLCSLSSVISLQYAHQQAELMLLHTHLKSSTDFMVWESAVAEENKVKKDLEETSSENSNSRKDKILTDIKSDTEENDCKGQTTESKPNCMDNIDNSEGDGPTVRKSSIEHQPIPRAQMQEILNGYYESLIVSTIDNVEPSLSFMLTVKPTQLLEEVMNAISVRDHLLYEDFKYISHFTTKDSTS